MEDEDFDLDYTLNRMLIIAEQWVDDRETDEGIEQAFDYICKGLLGLDSWIYKQGTLPVAWGRWGWKEGYGPE